MPRMADRPRQIYTSVSSPKGRRGAWPVIRVLVVAALAAAILVGVVLAALTLL